MKLGAADRTIGAATEVLKAIGGASNELTLFGSNHPRSEEALSRLRAALVRFSEADPGAKSFTVLLEGDCAEFRRIPLVEGGHQGERLVRRIREAGFEGLQVFLPIGPDGLRRLVARIARSRGPGPKEAEEGGGEHRFIRAEEVKEMRAAQEGRIAGMSFPESDGAILAPEFAVSESSIRSMLATCRTILGNREKGIVGDYGRLAGTVDKVVSLVSGKDLSCPRLARTYFDDFSYHHSINVCFIATTVASTIIGDEDLLRRISMAALLHDIGKREIPAEIIHKPGKLTPGEFELIRLHPVFGAEILLGLEAIDPLCVTAAFGHHIHPGPGSYPRTRKRLKTGWISSLISVVDAYEALTAVRPYKKALSPETAFRILFSLDGLEDRLPILRLVYRCVGPFPVGSIVELSSGERAVVVGKNEAKPERPRIRVLTGPGRTPIPEAKSIDLSQEGGQRIVKTIVAQSAEHDPLHDDPKEETTDLLGQPLDGVESFFVREG
jgi:putative nucleotidyltransferase with HDIG domain